MKTIKKINKYLVEHYPLIWNTRLVWMLALAVILHLGFFIAGFLSINSQENVAAHYTLSGFYYDSPALLIGSLISIVSLLLWIIYYLKNNAFKSLYPFKKGKLFLQFCITFVILFTNITHYYSYKKGVVTKIKKLYDWNEIDTDIKKFNNAAIFFLKNRTNYDIEEKQYPHPFPLESVSTDSKRFLGVRIDTTKPYLKYNDKYYQFYKLDKDLIAKDIENNAHAFDDVYNKKEYAVDRNPFRYRNVYDVTPFKNLFVPNLYNYSQEFIDYGQTNTDSKKRVKDYYNLLSKKDSNSIENELKKFFVLAEKYNVKHNLNIKDWLYLINLENDYKYIINIKDRKPDEYQEEKFRYSYFKLKTRIDTIAIPINISKKEQLYYDRFQKTEDRKSILKETEYEEYFKEVPYCDFGNLKTFFKNVHSSYNTKFDVDSLYVFIVMSILVALLLFTFKTTSIRNILLSAVAACVVMIFGILIIYILDKYLRVDKTIGILAALLINISLVVLSIIGLLRKWKKGFVSILFTLAQFAIPLIVLFSILYYKQILSYPQRNKDPYVLWFDEYGFWFTIVVWILGIFLYSKSIRNWRAWTE
ncbi:hypothetical protein [uncultured Tenacibaculum sp.]|uniref:hypothetical protein n=1 Tax=uncultured Tenacibaculum sp. TaxID=174713 RepID=UPI0026096468|nr:hypothetical protein [uncultured Tenacibaculum sp.]